VDFWLPQVVLLLLLLLSLDHLVRRMSSCHPIMDHGLLLSAAQMNQTWGLPNMELGIGENENPLQLPSAAAINVTP